MNQKESRSLCNTSSKQPAWIYFYQTSYFWNRHTSTPKARKALLFLKWHGMNHFTEQKTPNLGNSSGTSQIKNVEKFPWNPGVLWVYDFWVNVLFCQPLININLKSSRTELFVQPMLFVGFGSTSRCGLFNIMSKRHVLKLLNLYLWVGYFQWQPAFWKSKNPRHRGFQS